MTSYRAPSSRRASGRSRLTVAMAFTLLGLLVVPVAADELLSTGRWKGEYAPSDLGADIDADFCVQRDDARSPPWKVTMRLDLDPPGNRPIEFEDIQTKDDTLIFSINILDVRRNCVLTQKNEDELTLKCELADGDPDKTVWLTMRPAITVPEDECQPAPAPEDATEPASPNPGG